MLLPNTEVEIRPWPSHHPLPTGVVARHVPTGLSVIMTCHTRPAWNREAALRDLALIVVHQRNLARG